MSILIKNRARKSKAAIMMKRAAIRGWICIFLLFSGFGQTALAQRYLSDYDSTLFVRDTVRTVIKRFENLHVSGYIQPQFQLTQSKGAASYEGGNFATFSNNRFMLRRARVKIDYILPSKGSHFPRALFTFQIDATERAVNVRDMFLRIYEPNRHNISLTAGLFARPFGYEVNLSSAFRETPERGRASQILMPSERDLGVMLNYESQNAARRDPLFKFDIGIFNGQGLAGTTDFDQFKDLISRLTMKPVRFRQFSVGAGVSLLRGGWRQATRYRYEMDNANGEAVFLIDSSEGNIGNKAPRQYYGADAQLEWKHGWGKTEIRGEYWRGKQPGGDSTTTNPGFLPTSPTYIRDFDAAFFYFLQNIINEKWELMVKYDWYDPNIKTKGLNIGKTASKTTPADVKFATLGMGITRYFGDHLKLLAYYSIVRNEQTALAAYRADLDDNVFTLRFQLRF